MTTLIFLLCCCTRPDSIICKICEVRVSEKPGGKSAKRSASARSARSPTMSARSQAPLLDEEAAVGVDEVEVQLEDETAGEEMGEDEDMGEGDTPADEAESEAPSDEADPDAPEPEADMEAPEDDED